MIALFAKILLGLKAAGTFVLELLTAIVRWIFEDWRNGPLLMLSVFAAAHMFFIDPHLRADLSDAEKALKAEKQAHKDTVTDYRAAAAEADREAQANVARVKAEQAAKTEEIVDDFNARIADARARAARLERLRSEAGRTTIDPGDTVAAGLPGTGAAASGADQAPGENRLPDTGSAEQPLTPNERLIATEQAIQLDALIDWVIAQSSIPFQPVEAPTE